MVAQLLEKAFATPPLSLTTSRDPDAIVGICAKRPSVIIQDWHELATVRAVMTELSVSLSDPAAGTRIANGVVVGFATTLFVDNRNTSDESEWRMPSRDQSDAFDAAIEKTVRTKVHGSVLTRRMRTAPKWS